MIKMGELTKEEFLRFIHHRDEYKDRVELPPEIRPRRPNEEERLEIGADQFEEEDEDAERIEEVYHLCVPIDSPLAKEPAPDEFYRDSEGKLRVRRKIKNEVK